MENSNLINEGVFKTFFESLEPLRLRSIPKKEEKKIIVFEKIITSFENSKTYTEKEVNEILKEIYPDFAIIRRYLVDYKFLERTPDGKEYWVKDQIKLI